MTRRQSNEADKQPLLFLDVDGVLNAFAYEPLLAGYEDFTVHEVTVGEETGFRMTFDMCLSLKMGKSLAALPAEIVWLTTWRHDADRLIAPLAGLPQGLRVLSSPPGAQRADPVWKFDALRRSVSADPTPFVWLDDDIDLLRSESVSARRWADALSVPCLLIAPDPRTGLLPEQIEAVKEFLLTQR